MERNNDYTTADLLNYECFSKHYKLVAIDSSKQIELENSDLKQQINLIRKIERDKGATMFLSIEILEETTFEFKQNLANILWFWPYLKMEARKIVNLLGDADDESSKFATKKWYVINDESNGEYGNGDKGNDSSITFEMKVTKSSLCDYSDAYTLVTGDITAVGGDANTKVAFKNCAPVSKCITMFQQITQHL